MKMQRLIKTILVALGLILFEQGAAQHTVGFTVGYGMGSARLEPTQEMKGQWDMFGTGISWRHYSKTRVVGCFGVDLEFLQQGFAFATNAAYVESPSEYIYYKRKLNTIMLPIVWQPHFYLMKHRLRVYLEAAATFSYALSSTYENEAAHNSAKPDWKGDYDFMTARDNRWGYGLAGGGGVAVLIKRFELNFRVRYYFGYSDVVRNRNKYANNKGDGSENPFRSTPLRSPLDNLMISVGLNYRFNKSGFEAWKPRPKREKNKEVFKYTF